MLPTSIVHKRPILAGAIGNFIEVYDYSHYLFFAPIIATAFFPQENINFTLILTFIIFAIERLIRPIAGICIGCYVDKYGRSKTLYLSIMSMIITSTLMCFLPTYNSIGLLAPILLLLIRCLQGMLISGEFVTSMVYIYEHTPSTKKGVLGSLSFFSGIIGCLLSSGLSFIIISFFSKQFVIDWGWRIPYLFGLPILIVSYLLRKDILETPCFIKESRRNNKFFTTLLTENLKNIFVCFFITALSASTYSFFLTYMPTYLSSVKHLSLSLSMALVTFNLMFYALLLPIMGLISDRIGKNKLIFTAIIGILIFTYFFYSFLSNETTVLGFELIIICYLILISALNGPMPAFVAELFPVKTRTTSLAIGYGISLSIFGGLTPLICIYLTKITHNPNAPVIYILILTIIAFCILLFYLKQSKFLNLNYIRGTY